MANLESAEATEAVASTGRNVENLYKDKAGKLTPRPTNDVVGIVKRFKDTQEVIERDLSDFPEHILLAAAAFGFHQVGQNAYGAAKDTAEKILLCEARFETLSGGDWASDRQSGPGTSILVQAYIRAFEAKNGKSPDDAWVEQKRTQLKDENAAKEAQKIPAIKAALEAIKAERQAERAKKAQEAAGGADDDSWLD